MKLFSVRNGQKFAHFMQVSFSFTCMQEAHIQIGLFLPSHPPREEAEISSVRKSPKATPTSQADAVTHTPVAKSQSRSIYYPPPSPVFQCVSRLGPVGEARLFCQNCLPCPPPPPLPQQHLARACKCWLAWENSGIKCPQPRGNSRDKNACA